MNKSVLFFIVFAMLIIFFVGFIYFKKNRETTNDNIKWTIELGGKEVLPVEYEKLDTYIDDGLTEVEEGYAEFLILTPSISINNYTFIQVANEKEPGYMHIEVGLNKKDSNGCVVIMAKDNLTIGEVMDLFIKFYKKEVINMNEWYELEYK